MKIFSASVGVSVIVLTVGVISLSYAATTVGLGSADGFAVLGGSTITNTGSTTINGNVGLSPGTSVTGFPPGTINGTQSIGNAAATQAQTDLAAAYTNAAGQSTSSTVATELGGTTKTAGVYDSASGTFGINGTLTLDAQGNPNAVFIFKTASTLLTGGASSVALANGAQACNVFWQVGSSATLGTNSTFKGSILALQSATLTTGANVEGRVLARNGAVTLDGNIINRAVCVVATPTATPVSTTTPTPTFTATPTPSSTPAVTPTPTATPSSNPSPTPVPKLPNTGVSPQ